MDAHNPYAPPQAQLEAAPGLPTAQAPRLWNPKAAAAWSLLFSPIFGAALHTLNWRALGDDAAAGRSRRWLIGLCVSVGLLVVAAVLIPESRLVDMVFRAIGLALLLSWYLNMARQQQKTVAERFGTGYPRRGWGIPLLCAVLAFVGVLAVGVVIALIQAAIDGSL